MAIVVPTFDDARGQPSSLRSMSRKRPLGLDDTADIERDNSSGEVFQPKVPKVDPERDYSPSISTGIASSASSRSPFSSEDEETVAPALRAVTTVAESRSFWQEDGALDAAVKAAKRYFEEAWAAFSIERDAGYADELVREDRAYNVGELFASKKYEEMKIVLQDLMPWLGPMRLDECGHGYQVTDFCGCQPPSHLQKSGSCDGPEELLKARLEWLRSEPRGRAWVAYCALMTVVSARKEKCWFEAFDNFYTEMEKHLSNLSLCKSTKNARRKKEIRAFVAKECSQSCGFFSHYLMKPHANLRIAFATGSPRPTPSSLVITTRLPFWDALASLDDNGPLQGEASSRAWCMKAGRQFAFQAANFGVDEDDSRQCRAAAKNLTPDPKLRELLRSKKPVVQLEVVAALAPRDQSKKHGLSEIVKAELAAVMREAKNRGEAVVFCLGSDHPHKLAEKVYIRQPISDYGLRCGYLRWRASADKPWAREMRWDSRICLCLQMP